MTKELAPLKFTKTPLPELPAKLIEYDKQMVVRKYKFGILYVKDGQTEENEMFSNGTLLFFLGFEIIEFNACQ